MRSVLETARTPPRARSPWQEPSLRHGAAQRPSHAQSFQFAELSQRLGLLAIVPLLPRPLIAARRLLLVLLLLQVRQLHPLPLSPKLVDQRASLSLGGTVCLTTIVRGRKLLPRLRRCVGPQALIALATLRACFAVLQSAAPTNSAVRAPVDALCTALLYLLYSAIARLRAAHSAGVVPASRSASDVAEQDAMEEGLAALGCGGLLHRLRRLSLDGMLEAAEEARISNW